MNAQQPLSFATYLRAARGRYRRSLSGEISSARRFSSAMESLTRDLLSETLPAAPISLLPLLIGSVARGEASPYSDVDLWLVYEETALSTPTVAAAWKAFVEKSLPPLWDSGLPISPSLLAPRHLASLAQNDWFTWTGCFDARPLFASDRQRFVRFKDHLHQSVGKIRGDRAFLTRQADALFEFERRHCQARFDSTSALLEPDLMENPGALRDGLRFRCCFTDQFLRGDVLSSGSLLGVARPAHSFLVRARAALSFVAGRSRNVLRFERQAEVAEMLSLRSEKELLKKIHWAMREEQWYFRKCFERNKTHVKLRACVTSGEVCRPPTEPSERPLRTLDDALFLVMEIEREQRSDAYSRHAQIKKFSQQSHQSDDALARARCLSLFYEPAFGRAVILQLYDLELLPLLVPPLKKVAGLAQRDVFHTHAVDAHLMRAFLGASALILGEDTDAPREVIEAVAALESPQALLLSALLHDAGKGHGSGHAQRGAFLASEFLAASGASQALTEDVAWLIANHLEMSFLSQRRNFADPVVGDAFAAACATPERLRLLFVLAYVDASATGPLARTAYKLALLSTLFVRTLTILSPARAYRSKVPGALGSSGEHEIYSAPVEQSSLAPCVRVTSGEINHACHIEVLAPDREGLFLALVETLAALNLQVRQAILAAPQEGRVRDLFVIDCPLRDLPCPAEEIRDALSRAATDGPTERHQRRVQRQIAGNTREATQGSFPRILKTTLNAKRTELILDVQVPDQRYLLVAVARAFVPLAIDIHRAFLWTEGRITRDTFYLQRRHQALLFTEPLLLELKEALGQVLATRDRPC